MFETPELILFAHGNIYLYTVAILLQRNYVIVCTSLKDLSRNYKRDLSAIFRGLVTTDLMNDDTTFSNENIPIYLSSAQLFPIFLIWTLLRGSI